MDGAHSLSVLIRYATEIVSYGDLLMTVFDVREYVYTDYRMINLDHYVEYHCVIEC